MKKSLIFGFLFISIMPVFSADNPYTMGGSQFGGDDFYLENASNNTSTPYNTNNSCPQSNTVINNTNPYSQSTTALGTSPVNLNNNNPISTNTETLQNNAVGSVNNTEEKVGAWSKMENWFQRKTLSKNNTSQPELDLANQRIQAGKARIKVIKAKEKLDEHLADCQAKTKLLTEEFNRAEEQASLIENQVKFQESNSAK